MLQPFSPIVVAADENERIKYGVSFFFFQLFTRLFPFVSLLVHGKSSTTMGTLMWLGKESLSSCLIGRNA